MATSAPSTAARPGAAAGSHEPSRGRDGFQPVAVLEADAAEGIGRLLAHPAVAAARRARPGEAAPPARHALLLVRFHGVPLGLVGLDLADAEAERRWPETIEERLGRELAEHRLLDGLSSRTDLWQGVSCERPACLAGRRAALAKAPPASVVVATHERPDRLATCLASLRAQSYPELEIVVVDNAPRSGATAELVAAVAAGDRRVRYVREDQQGLGAAHNAGLEVARGDILAFTDDDVVADRHWLAELVVPFLSPVAASGVTGLILPAELETPAQLMLEAHGRFTKGFSPRHFDLGEHRPADRLFPFTAGRLGSGANMAFEAAALRHLGGFDAALGTGTPAKGGDDLDAIFRLIASGGTLSYQPAAIVWHHHRRELASLERQAFGYGVGLGAYLASVAIREPRRIVEMTSLLPRAGAYALAHTAPEAVAGGDLVSTLPDVPPWPRRLSRLQRRGLLFGPAAYLLSRRSLRRGHRPRRARASSP